MADELLTYSKPIFSPKLDHFFSGQSSVYLVTMFLTIVVFIITIAILVLIHELGHFLTAKKFNIKILEFGFGLPPRAIGRKIGETILSLNWLPFGGFVHLLGEDDINKKTLRDKRSFASQKVWKRIVVVVAGVVMNLLLAWFLYYLVLSAQNFHVEIPLLTNHQFTGVHQTNDDIILVQKVAPDSPAALAGINQSDRVIALNDEFLKDSTDLVEKIQQSSGRTVKLTLSDIRKTNFKTVEVTPRVNPPAGQGALGVALSSFKIANLDYRQPWQKVLAGPIHGYNLASYSFEVLGQTIATSYAKKDFRPISQTVAGPVGITAIVDDILKVKNPLIPYLDFMAALSLNLAIVNVLPFPGLDGGRLFFLVIEAITRKKPHPTFEKYLHTVGLAILIGLIVLVTASDLKKLFF